MIQRAPASVPASPLAHLATTQAELSALIRAVEIEALTCFRDQGVWVARAHVAGKVGRGQHADAIQAVLLAVDAVTRGQVDSERGTR